MATDFVQELSIMSNMRSVQTLAWIVALLAPVLVAQEARAEKQDPRVQKLIARGLDWVASTQSRRGDWAANDGRYPTAMTALAGVALLCEGSTTTQGKYAKNIR